MKTLFLILILAVSARADIQVASQSGSSPALLVKRSGVWYEVGWSLAAKPATAPIFSEVKLIRTGNESCAVLHTDEVVCWNGWDNLLNDTDRRSLGIVPSDTVQFEGYCLRTAADKIHCLQSSIVNDELKYAYHPVDTSGLEGKVEALSASSTHACLKTNRGRVYCWGENYGGKLGIGGFPYLQKPEDDQDWSVGIATPGIPFPTSAVKGMSANVFLTHVSAVSHTSCAMSDEAIDNVYCWGRISPMDGTFAQFDLFSKVTSPVAVRLDLSAVPGKRFDKISAGPIGGIGLAEGNQVYWWGGIRDQEISANVSLKMNYLASLPVTEKVMSLDFHGREVCVVTQAESLYCSRHDDLNRRKPEFIRVSFPE